MIVRDKTVLPEPDSPTTPIVSFSWSSKVTSVTAGTSPRGLWKTVDRL
jgi:hypothetical protein